MGKKKKFGSQIDRLEAEVENLRQSQRGTNLIAFFRLAFPYGTVIAVAYFISQTLLGLAGMDTNADIKVAFSADMVAKADKYIAWFFGGGGITYGLAERKFRKDKVKYLATRNAELEKMIDGKRTSSGLSPTGETHEEDKL